MSTPSIAAALDGISEFFTQQPERAVVRHAAATARLQSGLHVEITGPRDAVSHTDMPAALGGQAGAPSPGWLLQASLASCTATVIALRAAQLGIALTTLEVSVDSESDLGAMLGLDDQVSAGLRDLQLRVSIGAADASAQTLRELVAWADAHSPIGRTVRDAQATKVDVTVA